MQHFYDMQDILSQCEEIIKKIGKSPERSICKQMLELCTTMLIKHIRIDVLVLILLESRRQWFSDVQQRHIQRYKSTYIYSIVSLLTIYDNWYQMVLHFPFYKISTYPGFQTFMLRASVIRRFMSYDCGCFMIIYRSFPKGRKIVIVGGVAGGGSAAARQSMHLPVLDLDYDVWMRLHRLLCLKRDLTMHLPIVDFLIMLEV